MDQSPPPDAGLVCHGLAKQYGNIEVLKSVSLTLRPGPETPLWNALVRQVRPHLRKYGAKAQLARLLGLPRQRLQDCLKAGSACLDAERTLLLIGWLGFFQRGGELTPVVRPGRPRRQKTAPPVPGNV